MADIGALYPDSPSFETVNFKVNTPTLTSETFSGKLRRVGMGVSYYSWEVKYPSMTPLEAGTVQGFVAQTLGSQFSFLISIPKVSFSKLGQLQNTAAVFCANAAPVGSTQINFTGAQPTKFLFAAGDFVSFQNHSKVYQVVAPVQASSAGNGTIFFSCPLVTAVPLNAQINFNNIYFTAVMAENVQEWDVGVGGITGMSLSMREVW